jgi:hypothetical protein
MQCPSCKKTRIEEIRKEYIYPNVFLGLPAFWGFMSPPIAKVVTAVVLLISLAMGVLGLVWFATGNRWLALAPLAVFSISLYVIVVCVQSMDKYRIKNHYRCLSCRLEWSGFADDADASSPRPPAARRAKPRKASGRRGKRSAR